MTLTSLTAAGGCPLHAQHDCVGCAVVCALPSNASSTDVSCGVVWCLMQALRSAAACACFASRALVRWNFKSCQLAALPWNLNLKLGNQRWMRLLGSVPVPLLREVRSALRGPPTAQESCSSFLVSVHNLIKKTAR